MSWQDCADTLLVSRTTLWRRALELGITTMSEISDLELDSVVYMKLQTVEQLWYGVN